MNDSNPKTATNRFPTFQRFYRRWFNWRAMRRYLFVLACLATLLAVFYAEENWRGKQQEAAYRRQLEAKGESVDYRRFVPPPAADRDNFAATPFLAPLFDFLPGSQTARDTNAWQRTMSFAQTVSTVPIQGNWQAGQKLDLGAWRDSFEKIRSRNGRDTNALIPVASRSLPAARAILEALKESEPVLNELRAASLRPRCRFNLSYDLDNPAGILLPHLARIKGVCQVLELRAAAELELDQIGPAVNDVDLMLYLTDCLRSEPLLVSQLIRIACLHLTMQVVWEGLAAHKWPDAQLQTWQTRFRQFDFITDLDSSLKSERAWGNRIIDWVKNARSRSDYYAALTDAASDHDTAAASIFGLCPRGWFDLEKLNYNRLFEDSLLRGFDTMSRRIYPAVASENEKRLEKSLKGSMSMIWRHQLFSSILIPSIARVEAKFGRAQAVIDQAIVACALERHRLTAGQYPENLDALVPRFLDKIPNDVASAEPLKYRRADDRKFLLYSVGWNEKDDGGTPPGKALVDEQHGDWVWFSAPKSSD